MWKVTNFLSENEGDSLSKSRERKNLYKHVQIECIISRKIFRNIVLIKFAVKDVKWHMNIRPQKFGIKFAP
jgi:hypothetical protein